MNEEIRRRMIKPHIVIEDINTRRLIWYGRVNQKKNEKYPRRLIDWEPPETRKRRRPSKTWKKLI